MSVTIKLRKGFDLKITGNAEKKLAGENLPELYAVKPLDFPGLNPKLVVRIGDVVKAGTAVIKVKIRPEIRFVSPVSGTVTEVERGDRRKIMEVIIRRTGNDYIDFGKNDPQKMSREEIRELLLQSGLWPLIRQRPYHIVARPDVTPKSIFIPGFDSSPLAPDYSFIMGNSSFRLFQHGVNILSKLTDGKVNLVLNGAGKEKDVMSTTSVADISWFSGPHPAGNVGVHIHHIDPVNKGEVVWFVNPQDVITIGRLFDEGRYFPERIVALTGSEVINPQYYKTVAGASISSMVNGNVRENHLRYISGNVLTGSKISRDGYLGFYDSQVTVIPEGDYFELFGWAKPGMNKFSFSKTFLSKLFPKKSYMFDTNLHGGERAFVMTGQYEKVLPMDILPMQLFKAILAQDIDLMENLGIYEVAGEDFALCEFIEPSKIEIQSIVRQGLDLMIKEMS